MSQTKFSLRIMVLANSFGLAIAAIVADSSIVQAQVEQLYVTKQDRNIRVIAPSSRQIEKNRPKLIQTPTAKPEPSTVRFVPPPPPNYDAPSGRRKGGASRCLECKSPTLPLTALVPGDRAESALVLTATEYPSFWFYIPPTLTPNRAIEFVLQDDRDNYIYKTTFPSLETSAGIVHIPIPPTVPPLVVGRRYQWTLSVQEPTNSVFVQGFMQRVAIAPNLSTQLKVATPRERIALYAARGIWQDALSELAQLRRQNPEDTSLATEWIELLQSVGLGNIATQPFIQCCTSELVERIPNSQFGIRN